MILRKKRGSALVTVVALCAFLSLMTMSIMMMTTGGFTLRKQQNKRVENFYSADSGIEIAENEIIKTIDKAIDKGYEEVKKIENNPTDPNNIIIMEKPDWRDTIFKGEFQLYITNKLEGNIDNVDKTSKIYENFKRENEIKVNAISKTVEVDKDKQQLWTIISTFIDKDNKERIVEVDYKIEVPSYGKRKGDMISNDSILDYIMGVDGNAEFKITGNIEGYGDIWVRGNEKSEDGNSGIIFSESIGGTRNKWNGKIITPKNILFDSVGMNQDTKDEANDLYAEKLIILNNEEGNNHINLRDVNIRNDFIFDGNNSSFVARNYYGIDDIDSSENSTVEDIANNRASLDKSSSIIVNSADFGMTEQEESEETEEPKITASNIEVENDMYVMGTSYLKLNDSEVKEYKTGESISINKISEPYTNRKYIESGLSEEKYLYKYYNPLHLVDEKLSAENEYKKLNTTEKGMIVKNFFKEKPAELDSVLLNGVSVGGTIYSSGVMYDKGEVKGMSSELIKECTKEQNELQKDWQNTHEHSLNGDSIIDCKIRDFTEEVYMMGNTVGKNNAEEMFYEKVINGSVANSFNWGFIKDDLMEKDVLNHKDGYPIFYKDEMFIEEDVKIFKSDKTVGALGIYDGDTTLENRKINIVFNVSESKNKKKLIFTEEASVPNDSIKLPNYLLDSKDINIIISEGDIIINTGREVASSFYTKGNLVVDTGNNIKFGNLDVPNFEHLNNIFKELFGQVIGGVVDEGILDQGNGEDVVNSSDLLHQEKWELTK